MFRIISARHYRSLLADMERLDELAEHHTSTVKRAAVAEQASQFHEEQARYWKGVAARFIDQIGRKDGNISVPAMTEPAPPAPPTAHGILRGMGIDSLPQRSQETVPPTAPAILGVDEAAANDAVAAALSTT